jgi:hypothetical protein
VVAVEGVHLEPGHRLSGATTLFTDKRDAARDIRCGWIAYMENVTCNDETLRSVLDGLLENLSNRRLEI